MIYLVRKPHKGKRILCYGGRKNGDGFGERRGELFQWRNIWENWQMLVGVEQMVCIMEMCGLGLVLPVFMLLNDSYLFMKWRFRMQIHAADLHG